MDNMLQLDVTPPACVERNVRTPHPANATLSTIRDLSVAASSAIGAKGDRRAGSSWITPAIFFLVVEALSAASARLLVPSLLWQEAAAASFLPVFVATGFYWWRGRTKARVRIAREHAAETQEALKSFGYEAANAVSAIRANLIGALPTPQDATSTACLKEVKQGIDRIDAAINRAHEALARLDLK